MVNESLKSIFASAVLVMVSDTKVRSEEIESLKSEGKINQLISSFDQANQKIKEVDIISIFNDQFNSEISQKNLIGKSIAGKILKNTATDFSMIKNQKELHDLINRYASLVEENYREFATLICLFMAVIDRELATEEVDVLNLFAKAWGTEELLNTNLYQMGLLEN
tara:strand:+ start:206 stop:703 length:498 start_codon:yes stop_codon:yes gene_type:complete